MFWTELNCTELNWNNTGENIKIQTVLDAFCVTETYMRGRSLTVAVTNPLYTFHGPSVRK